MRTLTLLIFSLLALQARTQSWSTQLYAGAAARKGWITYSDVYRNVAPTYNPSIQLGIRRIYTGTKGFGWAANANVALAQLKYTYVSSRSHYSLALDAKTIALELGGQLRLQPLKDAGLYIHLGVVAAIPITIRGDWTRFYHDTPDFDTLTYGPGLMRLGKLFNMGPEAGMGYDFPLGNGRSIGPQVTLWLGMLEIWRDDVSIPYNPRIARLTIEIHLTL